jgi:hypothetical protein
MGSIDKNLKAYVRYDGSGRVVPGSLILRKQKPKVGKWTEIQGYECCNPNTTLKFADPILVDPIIQIRCNDTVVFEYSFNGTTFANLGEFITELSTNSSTSFLGTFSADDVTLILTMNYDIAKGLCPTGILTMVITD